MTVTTSRTTTVRSATATSTVLSQGASGPAVVELQQLLARAGFSPGPADGAFGPGTRAAVVAFQRARGLSADGVAGPQTFAALRGTAPSTPSPSTSTTPASSQPTLSLGASGPAVSELQRALTQAGSSTGGVDGSFGPATRAAVVAFQRARGLSADGVVGPQTWNALSSSFTPAPGPGPTTPTTNAAFRQHLLATAQSQVGTVEATNSNDGAVLEYPHFFGRGSEAWCADFVSWVSQHSGGSLNECSCTALRTELIQGGQWKGRTNPQPGDLVLFDWDHDGLADHVGLVKSVNANGTLTTIEGNTSGPNGREGVWEKTRTWDTVLGFGNPV
jgi:peptidoglycan hydrolase-like protein with peptidoglycan-binding domain